MSDALRGRISAPGVLKGTIAAIKGEKGDPFTYEDFTPEQLESLHGAELELRCVDNMIQWRLKAEPEEEWQDLVSVAEFQREAEAAAARAENAAAKLEGGLVLKKGEGVDSIVRVVSEPGGAGEDPSPKAPGESAIALVRYALASGKNSVALGYDSKATGLYAFVANAANQANGGYSAAFGGSNRSNGEKAFIGGGQANTVDAANAFASGYSNDVAEDAKNGFVANQDNEITAPNAAAFGIGNKASGDSSFVAGGNNEAKGIRSMAVGTGTKAIGDFSFAGGSTTEAQGNASFAIGGRTKAKQVFAYAGGNDTETDGLSGFAHGSGLRVTRDAQTAFGKYNAPAADLLFMLGNGTSENDRKNAFAVKERSIVIDGVELTADMLRYHVDGSAYVENDEAFNNQCIVWFNALGDEHFGRYVLNLKGSVYFIEIFRTNASYGVVKSILYNGIDCASVAYGSIFEGKFTGFNHVSLQNHNHDDRYYTEEEIDEKFANVSSGVRREFSDANNTGSYTTKGNESKFYIVTLTVDGYTQSLTVDYKSVSATTGKTRDFRVPDSQYTLRVTINSDDTVTFDLGAVGTIDHITGYY